MSARENKDGGDVQKLQKAINAKYDGILVPISFLCFSFEAQNGVSCHCSIALCCLWLITGERIALGNCLTPPAQPASLAAESARHEGSAE